MKLKVLTLNIWRYYEWEKRKEKVIEFLKEQDADIVFLQEVAYDERLKSKLNNQLDEINSQLNYPHMRYGKLMEMREWHGKPIDRDMHYGLGILSKFPIKHSEVVILPHVEKNKKFGFMHIVTEVVNDSRKKNIDIINVHFENTNEGSKEHLKQTLEWCRKREFKPIIAGDFNMKIIEDLRTLAEKDYWISYLIKEYKSFMPTEFSNDKKPVTLDYVICHKEKFKILDVECINNDISDHNPVIAKIEVGK